jgi:hypothetical protein
MENKLINYFLKLERLFNLLCKTRGTNFIVYHKTFNKLKTYTSKPCKFHPLMARVGLGGWFPLYQNPARGTRKNIQNQVFSAQKRKPT